MSKSLLFELSHPGRVGYTFPPSDVPCSDALPQHLRRKELPHLPEMSELGVVRHYSHLAKMAYGVDHGPYPLGSCTMKYNPKLHNRVAALEGFSHLHPLQEAETAQGALALLYNLTSSLAAITGMDWGTMQPSAGAHGEYTGLKIIKAYHEHRGDTGRTKVIVPVSAHGTNPASAALTGFTIVEVPADSRGLVDIAALEELLDDSIAAIMLTNPNTLGLFEQDILPIATMVHACGGLLYYDGANMNAIMGIARPGDMGFDVVHLNLHKTFSTPHGGGGPGAGPVLVVEKLRPFLPKPDVIKTASGFEWDWRSANSIGKVSGFWGNFLVLVKAYAYILTMGKEGLRAASQHAVLNANYMQSLLSKRFTVPFNVICMHEFVVSLQNFKEMYGVNALDFAKGMLDRGYHPPTMYFPLIVHEALMFEPTETEAIEDLEAMVEALFELADVAETDPKQLKEAPRTTEVRRLDEIRAAKFPILRWREEGK